MKQPFLPPETIVDTYCAKYESIRQLRPVVEKAIQTLIDCFRNGGKLLVCGNGGSAADADHIVGELMKGFVLRRPLDDATRRRIAGAGEHGGELAEKLEGALPAINLCAHASLTTAVVNDMGGDYIFAQQVLGYGKAGDVFLGISTSGNAKNILFAGEIARAIGMTTVGMTGSPGGKMAEAFDIPIKAPATATADIQDTHSLIYHLICAAVEATFWRE